MMTPEQVAEVERLAGLMFSAREIGLITGVISVQELGFELASGSDQFALALVRGRLREEAEVRKSIFELAKAGSAPAQTLAMQLITQAQVAAAGS